jgi:glycosyltransferase involved in cell wall biosynthesis
MTARLALLPELSDAAPLRLVLVTETFPPEVNGVARTLGRWVQAFQERGHTVSVIRPRQKGERRGPLQVYGMPLPFYQQVRIGIASPVRMRRMLAALAPDLVHIATEGPLGWSALFASRSLGLPVASSFHTNFDHYASHYGLFGIEYLAFAALRWFHNRTRVTLVPSQATRQRLMTGGIRNVEIWSRGVDADLFNPSHRDRELRSSLGLDDDGILLLYVGRLAAEKNLGALMQAYNRLRSTAPPSVRDRLRLALVGDGPMAEPLAADSTPGLVLVGVRHGLELSRWYASADVFVFPSLSETFGNVVLEAQASGLPTVGFDCQGVNERVADGNGFLVPVEGDLSGPLLRLCTDARLRRSFAEAARTHALSQDWHPIFDELEDRYRRLVGERLVVPTT